MKRAVKMRPAWRQRRGSSSRSYRQGRTMYARSGRSCAALSTMLFDPERTMTMSMGAVRQEEPTVMPTREEEGIQLQQEMELKEEANVIQGRLSVGRFKYGCKHYRRRCKIRAPCCNEIFDCRHCHDEAKNINEVDDSKRHDIPRHHVEKVLCIWWESEGRYCFQTEEHWDLFDVFFRQPP